MAWISSLTVVSVPSTTLYKFIATHCVSCPSPNCPYAPLRSPRAPISPRTAYHSSLELFSFIRKVQTLHVCFSHLVYSFFLSLLFSFKLLCFALMLSSSYSSCRLVAVVCLFSFGLRSCLGSSCSILLPQYFRKH